MHTFTVRHSCGHEAPHAIDGTEERLRQRERWLQDRPCPTCWRAERSCAAAAQTEAWNLPALEGSEEEKAWAEVIRAKCLTHSRDFRDRVADPARYPEGDEAIREAAVAAANEALKELEGQSRAAWWIENRFESLNHLKRRIAAAIAPILEARIDP